MAKKRDESAPVRADGPIRVYKDSGEISVETNELPKSDRCYVAQAVRVFSRPDSAHFHFGQIVNPRKVLSIAIVELTKDSLMRLHETIHEGFRENLGRFRVKDGAALTLRDDEIENLAEGRFFVCSANIGRMTLTEVGAQVDWFQLEPAEIRRIGMNRPFRQETLTAPLTVMLTGELLAALVDEIDEAVKGLGERAT